MVYSMICSPWHWHTADILNVVVFVQSKFHFQHFCTGTLTKNTKSAPQKDKQMPANKNIDWKTQMFHFVSTNKKKCAKWASFCPDIRPCVLSIKKRWPTAKKSRIQKTTQPFGVCKQKYQYQKHNQYNLYSFQRLILFKQIISQSPSLSHLLPIMI